MSQILVVDDERTIQESLALLLEGEGYNVDTAPGAEEAWSLINKNDYDLVLTDLLMPKVDGFELIKRIRLKYGKRIPVIILTAHGTVEIASLAINEGVDDFIIKPFEIKTVTDAVAYALQKHKTAITKAKQAEESVKQKDKSFEKKFFGLSSLDAIGQKISSTTEVDEICDALLEQIRTALRPDRGLLLVYHKDQLTFKYQRLCNQEQMIDEGPSTVDRGVLEWVKKSGQPLLIEDMANDQQYRACFYGMLHSGSLIALPFKRHQRILGALIMYRQAGLSSFTEDNLQYLSVLSTMTAVALENLEIYDEMKSYFTGTIRALITTVETKDSYTFGHSARVARYTLKIAEALDLDEMEKRRLEYIALLHDIGKIGIPETVLRKKDALTDEDWDVLKSHPELGENIVRSIHFLPDGASVVRHHHEFYNGTGYPDGLKGAEIPLYSRIIAIADAFDAMNSGRPYKKGIGQERSFMELERCKGTQFDPELVQLFVDAYSEY